MVLYQTSNSKIYSAWIKKIGYSSDWSESHSINDQLFQWIGSSTKLLLQWNCHPVSPELSEPQPVRLVPVVLPIYVKSHHTGMWVCGACMRGPRPPIPGRTSMWQFICGCHVCNDSHLLIVTHGLANRSAVTFEWLLGSKIFNILIDQGVCVQ